MLRYYEFDHQTKWSSREPPPDVPCSAPRSAPSPCWWPSPHRWRTSTRRPPGSTPGPPAGRGSSSSMSIGLGAFLLTAGRVADDFGRRRTFVAGCARARGSARWSRPSRPTWRSSCSPASSRASAGQRSSRPGSGMIATAFPDPLERARATGWWGASVGAGIAVGPDPVDLARALALLAGRVRRRGRGRRGARADARRGCPESRAGPPRAARRPGSGAAGPGHECAAGGADRGSRGLDAAARRRACWRSGSCCWRRSWRPSAAPTTR